MSTFQKSLFSLLSLCQNFYNRSSMMGYCDILCASGHKLDIWTQVILNKNCLFIDKVLTKNKFARFFETRCIIKDRRCSFLFSSPNALSCVGRWVMVCSCNAVARRLNDIETSSLKTCTLTPSVSMLVFHSFMFAVFMSDKIMKSLNMVMLPSYSGGWCYRKHDGILW